VLSSPGAFSSRATLSRFCCGLALVNQSTVKSLKRSFHKKPERMHHLFLPSLKMGTVEERKTSLFYAICSGDTLYSISRRNYSSYSPGSLSHCFDYILRLLHIFHPFHKVPTFSLLENASSNVAHGYAGPSCSANHLPGYINSPKLKDIDRVFVVSVNDPFVCVQPECSPVCYITATRRAADLS